MAISSWMMRSRTLRAGRYDRRKENDEDSVKIDLTKDASENCKEILDGLCSTGTVSEAKRVNYLNAFVKLLTHLNGVVSRTGFTTEELLCCLRVALVNESTQVRAGGLRAVRHILFSEKDSAILNSMRIPYLIARSIDVVLRNEIERVQALKLARRTLVVSARIFDPSLVRCLVALADAVAEDKDRMLRACLAVLCELAILNPSLLIECGGVAAITRNILECQMPRIVECLCGALLHLVHGPITRVTARVDLHCLAAPYCDFHYRHAWMDKNRDERELRFNCSRLALLSVLRSWPGVLHFCSPANACGLRAIIAVLHLNQLEVRKAVLDLLYELLGLPLPDWTDEYSVALNAVDPSDPQDAWRLADGFVAAEARSILPHLARTTPNLAEVHTAVLLYVFLELGLLAALVEVIVTSDTFISVRATILLGELLHMAHTLLPPECCDVTPALPNLLACTVHPNPDRRYQAMAAVTALHQLHALLKRRPAPSSLYLDHALRSGRTTNTRSQPIGRRGTRPGARLRVYQLVTGDISAGSSGGLSDALRESGVLQGREGLSWNWDVIRAVLMRSWSGQAPLRMDESENREFVRRLVHYYQPSSNRYSHLELGGPRRPHAHTVVGCELVRCLLAMMEVEGAKLLHEWFADVAAHVDAISTSKSAHDCLFSPQHMTNTLCQTYFLFVGEASRGERGVAVLRDLGMFDKLATLGSTTNHVCYTKLIVAGLDYVSEESPGRRVYARILERGHEPSRLYAARHMLALLRAGLPARFDRWAVRMLVGRLTDESRAVATAAMEALHEACERPDCLARFVELRPDLRHLGDAGILLAVRALSTHAGLEKFEREGGPTAMGAEIDKWADHWCRRYVHLMEAELLDSLTLHQHRSAAVGWCSVSRAGPCAGAGRRDVYVLPHLYGQLVQHARGLTALERSGRLGAVFRCVRQAECVTEAQALELKAALWACGHLATSARGAELLLADGDDPFSAVVRIAQQCPLYGVRGTAIYVLALMGTTYKGANALFELGWACVRHDRQERWPVVEEEEWCGEGDGDGASRSRTNSERASTDNTYWTDETPLTHTDDYLLLLPEIDGNTATDDECPTTLPNKSSTLPYSTTGIGGIPHEHRRSLSESKTVDVLGKRVDDLPEPSCPTSHRHRDNSCTESTTSGVSSCDSALGRYGTSERTHTLSPIPSSSSLSTLRTGGVVIGSHQQTNGVRRVSLSAHSSSASNSVTVSPPDAGAARLSHQDLVGYWTLRSLRRVRLNSRNSGKDESIAGAASTPTTATLLSSSPVDVVFSNGDTLPPRFTSTDFERDALENALYGGPGSLQAVTAGRKRRLHSFSLRNESRDTSRAYMGICLPRLFAKLFPEERPAATVASRLAAEALTNSTKQVGHESNACLLCCRVPRPTPHVADESCSAASDTETKLKSEVLRHIERLSNPVWMKQSKQSLLHLKQRHASTFQDVCLYSEMCHMISTASYRLSTRRFLQELFLDLDFSDMTREPANILASKPITSTYTSPPTTSSHLASVAEEDKSESMSTRLNRCTLDDLKLTCSENKFPITTRVEGSMRVTRSYSCYPRLLRSNTMGATSSGSTSPPPVTDTGDT